MAVRSFDRKFGEEFLESLPGSPGVYLVYDEQAELIYVGKAINLKRRLSQYRNAVRRKKHRRMRGIVKEAARIEIQCAETHLDACLTETMLIQKHRPRWNIAGAYWFLCGQAIQAGPDSDDGLGSVVYRALCKLGGVAAR